MISTFDRRDGSIAEFDLDAVFDIIRTCSVEKPGWMCLVVFDPISKEFIELRDSPPDYRGNSKDEAVEATKKMLHSYGLSEDQLSLIQKNPTNWKIIDAIK
jgi:hypothetical protein